MSKTMLTLVASLVLGFQAQANNADLSQVLNETPKIREIPVTAIMNDGLTELPGGIGAGTCKTTPNNIGIGAVLDEAQLTLDKIINMGRQVWDIIEKSQPVLDLKVDVATALPQGVNCWASLSNWNRPQAKAYEVVYENALGMEAIRYAFQVEWLPGGQVNSKGNYVGYAAIIPVDVYGITGFKLYSKSSVQAVFNAGSSDSPVGALKLIVNWRVKGPFQKFEQAMSFYVDGKGEFQHVGTQDLN